MLSSKFLRPAKHIKYVRFFSTNSIYEENTVAGLIKEARRKNEWLDCVRFDGQNFNWSIKDFDVYTSAFAYGLVDQGYKPGDKLLLWLDQEHSAEIAVAQVGALKSGVTIVTVDERDEVHDVGTALEASGAQGLLLSPHTKADGKTQRANLLLELMPELVNAYPGQRVTFDNFPNLRNVIHTGHVTIRGTTKFKENMLYTRKAITNYRIPGAKASSAAMECYANGERVNSVSNQDLLNKARDIWKNHLDGEDKNLPVFLTLSLQYPLGFASFLASVMNGRKVFVPSTYNVAKIAKSFNYQKSDILVCEEDIFGFEPPAEKYDEIKHNISHFKKVLVGGSGKAKGESHIFSGVDTTHSNLYLQ
jgi:hypothetical protein